MEQFNVVKERNSPDQGIKELQLTSSTLAPWLQITHLTHRLWTHFGFSYMIPRSCLPSGSQEQQSHYLPALKLRTLLPWIQADVSMFTSQTVALTAINNVGSCWFWPVGSWSAPALWAVFLQPDWPTAHCPAAPHCPPAKVIISCRHFLKHEL